MAALATLLARDQGEKLWTKEDSPVDESNLLAPMFVTQPHDLPMLPQLGVLAAARLQRRIPAGCVSRIYAINETTTGYTLEVVHTAVDFTINPDAWDHNTMSDSEKRDFLGVGSLCEKHIVPELNFGATMPPQGRTSPRQKSGCTPPAQAGPSSRPETSRPGSQMRH